MIERRMAVIDGMAIPLNLTEENPNGIEYDNLYVDMNGLIHPCSHPEDREAPCSESEMYINVTLYLDRLFAAVRPRRLLYLAIDGVAPRAKMNQQRSRRFRAAQDAKEKIKTMAEVREEMLSQGIDVPPPKEGGEWDSNVITPGTEFMARLSIYIWFYVMKRMNDDPAWRNIKVVLSDASEPGEGEHKIMSFIRDQRAAPGYDANQRHILHGLDADLIMLALATHEPHFSILREEVLFGKQQRDTPKSEAQKFVDAQSNREGAAISSLRPQDEWVYGKKLQVLHINILREYLANEFKCLEGNLPFVYDFERIIDDFVFLCFFVGNDFLPHLPSLDIRDGAIDFLIVVYKDLLPKLGDYITSPGGNVNLEQVEVVLARVGEIEDEVFRRRKQAEEEGERIKKERAARNTLDSQRKKRMDDEALERKQKEALLTFGGVVQLHGGRYSKTDNMDEFGTDKTTSASTTTISSSSSSSKRNPDNSAAAKRLRESMVKKVKTEVSEVKLSISVTATDSSMSEETVETETVISEVGEDEEPRAKRCKSLGTEDTPIQDFQALAECKEGEEGAAVVPFEGGTCDMTTAMTVAEPSSMHDIPADIDDDEAELFPNIDLVILRKIKQASADAKEMLAQKLKEKESKIIDSYKETVKDDIKLHEKGFKERYYDDPYKKKDVEVGGGGDLVEGRKRMCVEYIKGLCWVMKYYYEGCPSWNWYYPFHYSPFASDCINIDKREIVFEKSKPFRPVEQLLAVLPQESCHALPEECQWLMTDERSPIIDIYVDDAPLDPNGKHLPWLWVLLLPFIDDTRISDAFQRCKERMCLHNRKRNAFGHTVLFAHRGLHQLGIDYGARAEYGPGVETDAEVVAAIEQETVQEATTSMMLADSEDSESCNKEMSTGTGTAADVASTMLTEGGICSPQSDMGLPNLPSTPIDFDPTVGNGISGLLAKPPPQLYAPLDNKIPANICPDLPRDAFEDIDCNQIMCVSFRCPTGRSHSSALLDTVQLPPPVLTEQDLTPRRPPRLGRFNIIDLAFTGDRKMPAYIASSSFSGGGGGFRSGGYEHQGQGNYNRGNGNFLPNYAQQTQQYGYSTNSLHSGYGFDDNSMSNPASRMIAAGIGMGPRRMGSESYSQDRGGRGQNGFSHQYPGGRGYPSSSSSNMSGQEGYDRRQGGSSNQLPHQRGAGHQYSTGSGGTGHSKFSFNQATAPGLGVGYAGQGQVEYPTMGSMRDALAHVMLQQYGPPPLPPGVPHGGRGVSGHAPRGGNVSNGMRPQQGYGGGGQQSYDMGGRGGVGGRGGGGGRSVAGRGWDRGGGNSGGRSGGRFNGHPHGNRGGGGGGGGGGGDRHRR